MKWYDSVKVKLIGFFLLISILFLTSIVITFFLIRENNLKTNATKEATLATAQILEHIKTTQAKAEEIVLTLSSVAQKEFAHKLDDQDGIIASILNSNNKNRIDIVSGGVWFEPYSVRKNIKNYMLFYNRDKKGKFQKIKNYVDNYHTMEFYTLAKNIQHEEVVWTDVYSDPVTHIRMITVSSPIYRGTTFLGVASIDLKIGNTDQEFWDSQEIQSMYMMMIDKNGNFIGKSNKLNPLIKAKNIYRIDDQKIKNLVTQIKPDLMHKEVHSVNSHHTQNRIFFIDNDPVINKDSVVAIYHFSDTHWNIIIGIPEDIVLAQSNQIYINVLTLIIILTVLATILGYALLQKLFVEPLASINEQLKENLAEDSQNYKLLHCEDKGEIGVLIENLNARTQILSETQAREAEEIKKRTKNEKMLLQQSKMAAMGEMMDAVAHQWKQPLNALSMYADIIKNDFEAGEVDQAYIRQYREDIQMQIDHMVNTLDEFRTFFRPNKGNALFNVTDVIGSVLFLTKDDLLKNRITVTIEQSDSIEIEGSANEFKHLILNIINNAKDAFNDKQIEKREIIIRLINDQNGDRIEIEDNAGGIPEEIMTDIFKANVTSKEEGKGTGIGLYMSQQIATKHHAKLTVENRKNGACFIVQFKSHLNNET